MADNYLEKRMEDLRSGKLNTSGYKQKHTTGTPKAGYLSIPFPERRVLIVGSCGEIGEAIASAFRKAGCKTALFDADKTTGERLAHDIGIRFHNTDTGSSEDLQKSLGNLLNAWHDIDITVCIIDDKATADEMTRILCDTICNWRHQLPFPNPFGGRFIAIFRNFTGKDIRSTETLSQYGFTTNSIVIQDSERLPLDSVSGLCLFLCAPGNECIHRACIPVRIFPDSLDNDAPSNEVRE